MRVARPPKPLGSALRRALDLTAPATPLAAVQRAWPQVAGAGIANQAQAVAERDGVVTIACRSAIWAQELDLLQTELLERLNEALYAADPGACRRPLKGLRFTADAHRHTD
jgi:predicted nucleic acid-binding Zn ribbon protein